jgi:F1F0 ATPase subunit 2
MTISPEHVFWLLAGGVLGAVYLAMIGYSVRTLVGGRSLGALPYLALRLALAGVVFFMAAKQGWPALVLLLCGFLIVRTIVIGRVRAGE